MYYEKCELRCRFGGHRRIHVTAPRFPVPQANGAGVYLVDPAPTPAPRQRHQPLVVGVQRFPDRHHPEHCRPDATAHRPSSQAADAAAAATPAVSGSRTRKRGSCGPHEAGRPGDRVHEPKTDPKRHRAHDQASGRLRFGGRRNLWIVLKTFVQKRQFVAQGFGASPVLAPVMGGPSIV